MPPVHRSTLFASQVAFPPGEESQPWTAPPDHWNLSYTLGGSVREILACGETRQQRGDLMLLKPGGSHSWQVPVAATEAWLVIYFVFVPPPSWLPLLDLPEEFPRFTHLSLTGRPAERHVRRALREACRLVAMGHGGEALALNALERALLWLHVDRQATRTGEDPRIRAAMEIFTRRLDAPPTIPEVAAACRLSPSRLRDLFLAHTGVPPAAWHERVRLNHARSLLLTTGLPIKLIASACGYHDQRYFATRFRRLFATTPSACRAVE